MVWNHRHRYPNLKMKQWTHIEKFTFKMSFKRNNNSMEEKLPSSLLVEPPFQPLNKWTKYIKTAKKKWNDIEWKIIRRKHRKRNPNTHLNLKWKPAKFLGYYSLPFWREHLDDPQSSSSQSDERLPLLLAVLQDGSSSQPSLFDFLFDQPLEFRIFRNTNNIQCFNLTIDNIQVTGSFLPPEVLLRLFAGFASSSQPSSFFLSFQPSVRMEGNAIITNSAKNIDEMFRC